MRHALALAERALGRTAPNPAVGCVIVTSDGRIVGRGWTQPGGRPHAETVALKQAGETARGATAYVTLEPCAHHGKTPPCAEALIAAGVSHVVVAVSDPDLRVNGNGIAKLREGGIQVVTGVLEREAATLNRGFFLRVTQGRPLVTLKAALSLDGKSASASGESKWITGEEARRFGHLLRARHDAILVGIDTALADDPELTCRIAGLETRSPMRVVLDSRLRLPPDSKLALSAQEIPTLVFTTTEGGEELRAKGIEVMRVAPDRNGHIATPEVLKALAQRGVTRLLVEGGAKVHAAFLDAGVVDRLEVFTAPVVLGENGRSGISALTARGLKVAPGFLRVSGRAVGVDRLESYVTKP